MTPLSPPTVNRPTSPAAKWKAVVGRIAPPQSVAIQLKILIPVGIAISIVAIENAASATGPMPVANMWWLHTPKPKNPISTPE